MTNHLVLKTPKFHTHMMQLALALSVVGCSIGGESESSEQVEKVTMALTQGITANVTMTSRWTDGYCASVVVVNTTSAAIAGWEVKVLTAARTVRSISNASGVVSGVPGTVFLLATPLAYNALLAPNASTEFGFCGFGPTGSGPPVLVSAVGFPVTDVPAGLSAALVIKSDWSSGYCADVVVTNQSSATTFSWQVVLDLAQSTLSNAWNATSSTAGTLLTLRPLSYNTVLNAGASTTAGFCAAKTGPAFEPHIVSPVPPAVNQ